MSGIEHIRLPTVMRSTPLPAEPKHEPKPILDPNYIESVVPQTPLDLLDQTTGLDIARDFEAKRIAAEEAICRDALVYLDEVGMTPTAVVEIIEIRRGNEHGVTKEKIEQAVSIAVGLLEKQREKSK